MKIKIGTSAWWGAPQKFSLEKKDRKISWLELFYDLVYVIAISKITHQLAAHLDGIGLLDYSYFFMIIFWSWLNGSLYHDLHASEGLRTRLMTLWQILIIAAFIVTIHGYKELFFRNTVVVMMVMQLYITYLWWSVGFYDKNHRRLNRPYTILYLISSGFMLLSLFVGEHWFRLALFASLLLNFLPPFLTSFLKQRASANLSLSSSMTERLGLFTIIVFGEVMSGIITGIDAIPELTTMTWLDFGLSVVIVFALWWLFFTLVSDRLCKKGFIRSTVLEIIYIPTLLALGLLGMSFTGIYSDDGVPAINLLSVKSVFGFSIGLFLLGVCLMLFLLEYPIRAIKIKVLAQRALLLCAFVMLIGAWVNMNIPLTAYLSFYLFCILLLIAFLNYQWYAVFSKLKEQ